MEEFTAALGLRLSDCQALWLCATAALVHDNTVYTPRNYLCTGCLLRTPCILYHHTSCIHCQQIALH